MRKILAAVLAGIISASFGWCEDSSENQKTVAVCEFEVTGPKDVDADWIKQGVPDLLQIKLQDQGISLLDRDFVASVLREQRREASGVMDGRNRVGGLLGARILVEGEAKLEGGNVRLSATAATVPENEVVATSSVEGEYPKDVNKLIEKLGRELGAKLAQYTHSEPPARPADRYVPSPEVMILFHKALDLYGRGFPAASAAWFNFVTRADLNFDAAKVWEVKAYRDAGFAEHARIAAQKHGIAATQEVGPKKKDLNGRRIVRIMPLQIDPAIESEEIDPDLIRNGLEKAVLENGTLRLYDADTIKEVVAELDLRLADGFAGSTMPRYDQWLAVDGLVSSKIVPTGNGDMQKLRIDVLHPMSGRVLTSAKNDLNVEDASTVTQRIMSKLTANWSSGSMRAAELGASKTSGDVLKLPKKDGDLNRCIEFASLLNRRRIGEDVRRRLVEIYAGLGEIEHMKLELKDLMKSAIDPGQEFSFEQLCDLFKWMSRKQGIVNHIDRSFPESLCDRIVSEAPESKIAAEIFYNRGLWAYDAGDWESASEHFKSVLKGESINTKACYYMLARCDFELGRKVPKEYLNETESYLMPVPDSEVWPKTPIIHRETVSILVSELRRKIEGTIDDESYFEQIMSGKEYDVVYDMVVTLRFNIPRMKSMVYYDRLNPRPRHIKELLPEGNQAVERVATLVMWLYQNDYRRGVANSWESSSLEENLYRGQLKVIENTQKKFIPVLEAIIDNWNNSSVNREDDYLPGYLFAEAFFCCFWQRDIENYSDYADRTVKAYLKKRGLINNSRIEKEYPDKEILRYYREGASIYRLAHIIIRFYPSDRDQVDSTWFYKFFASLDISTPQFLETLTDIAHELQKNKRYKDAADLYRRIWDKSEDKGAYTRMFDCLVAADRADEIEAVIDDLGESGLTGEMRKKLIAYYHQKENYAAVLRMYRQEFDQAKIDMDNAPPIESDLPLDKIVQKLGPTPYKIVFRNRRTNYAIKICGMLYRLKRFEELHRFAESYSDEVTINGWGPWATILYKSEENALAAKFYDKVYYEKYRLKHHEDARLFIDRGIGRTGDGGHFEPIENALFNAALCYNAIGQNEKAAKRFSEYVQTSNLQGEAAVEAQLTLMLIRSGKKVWREWKTTSNDRGRKSKKFVARMTRIPNVESGYLSVTDWNSMGSSVPISWLCKKDQKYIREVEALFKGEANKQE